MKYVLIIPDGCADEPQKSLAGRTPLQAANTPHMDAVANAGLTGQIDNVPASLPAGSDVGTMSLFGYDPLEFHTGRAPIEAAAMGVQLGTDDWAIRCNLVTIQDGVMISFTAGQIPSPLGRELIELLADDQRSDECWSFHPGVSYRNLVVYRPQAKPTPFTSELLTTPPHDLTDQLVGDHLPRGPGAEALLRMMDRSVELFQASPANCDRRDAGKLTATQVWLWGIGRAPALTPFVERFGKTAAVITAVDLLRGLGQLLGWQVVEVPGATGYLDTDYAAKASFAVKTLEQFDLVVVHVEATDEASHEGDAAAKVEALERIDHDIVGPMHEHLKSGGEYRLLVSPDHPTFLRTKTHSHGYVPFAMCGTGVACDSAACYDELTAQDSDIAIPGHELMPMFLANG